MPAPNPLPSTEQVRHLFDYCAEIGRLRWRERPPRWPHGKELWAGTCRDGYYGINLKGKPFLMHRLVWVWHGKALSEIEQLDHIDGNPSNNLIANLRISNHQENMQNRRLFKTNKSGIKNVHWDPKRKKWHVTLGVDGTNKYIGRFEELEAAELAATMAREKYYGEFARHA